MGGESVKQVDVRIVAATHRDLRRMVDEGDFREDLYYRLAVVTVPIPPLRDRPDDVPALVEHFLEKHRGGRAVRVDRAALAVMRAHRWPGNVRELENEIQRALVLASGDVIERAHLSPEVRGETDEDAPDELDLKAQIALLEKRLIRAALDRAGGNQTRAAQLLGVSRYGLQKMLRRLEIA